MKIPIKGRDTPMNFGFISGQTEQLMFCEMYISPVLIASTLELRKVPNFFVQHFASGSIVRKRVLPKKCSLLWDWTPSHAQRIYKGQNSENPLRAITFDWSDLRT